MDREQEGRESENRESEGRETEDRELGNWVPGLLELGQLKDQHQ